MNEQQASSAPAGLTLRDILYTIFRHKGKIAAISVVSLVLAVCVKFFVPTVYQSEAKLVIKYVVERAPKVGEGGEPRFAEPDDRGQNILNTELEILTSSDLALQV